MTFDALCILLSGALAAPAPEGGEAAPDGPEQVQSPQPEPEAVPAQPDEEAPGANPSDVEEVDAPSDESNPSSEEAEDETAPLEDAQPPAPGVFAPTEAPDATPPPPEPNFDAGVAPGGYWEPGEAPEVAPPDGREQTLVGAILVPFGALVTASAAGLAWATVPSQCQDRLGRRFEGLDRDDCKGLFIYNVVRASYGGLMLVTGSVFLGIGLHRRRQLEKWKQRRFRAGIEWTPGGLGARASFRF